MNSILAKLYADVAQILREPDTRERLAADGMGVVASTPAQFADFLARYGSRAVEEAELMAGVEIDQVHLALSGPHIKGFNSHGVVAVKKREVEGEDVDRVMEAARAVALPTDREVLHVEVGLAGEAGLLQALPRRVRRDALTAQIKVHLV